MIEQSPAFKDGGLIDITFDEGNPPFTYSGNSFNNANAYAPDLGGPAELHQPASRPTQPGENIFGQNVHFEPTGRTRRSAPTRRVTSSTPAPATTPSLTGRRSARQTTPTLVPANCVPGIVRGGSGSPPGARTDAVATGIVDIRTSITDNSIVADDTGRRGHGHQHSGELLRRRRDRHRAAVPDHQHRSVINGSFQLVDQNGNPVDPTGPVSGITLSAEGDPGTWPPDRRPTRCTTPTTRRPAAATPAAS